MHGLTVESYADSSTEVGRLRLIPNSLDPTPSVFQHEVFGDYSVLRDGHGARTRRVPGTSVQDTAPRTRAHYTQLNGGRGRRALSPCSTCNSATELCVDITFTFVNATASEQLLFADAKVCHYYYYTHTRVHMSCEPQYLFYPRLHLGLRHCSPHFYARSASGSRLFRPSRRRYRVTLRGRTRCTSQQTCQPSTGLPVPSAELALACIGDTVRQVVLSFSSQPLATCFLTSRML